MINEDEPPQAVIDAALKAAREGRAHGACAKSSRGAVVFSRTHGGIWGVGYNAPPAPFQCSGTEACRKSCGRLAVHAEQAAIVAAMPCFARLKLSPVEMVHVKIDEGGALVAGGPPSCEQCSKLILHAEISAMWLFEATPSDWCPHLDRAAVDCTLCQGEDCERCVRGVGDLRCEHDVLERHGTLPVVGGRWRRYTAEDFHRATLRNLGLGR